MSALTGNLVLVLLMQRYGWTASQVNEMPETALTWLLDHPVD